MSSSYRVWLSCPQLSPVAFTGGMPAASMVAGSMNRSMAWPPTLERTRPMGTCAKAGTLSLRWKAV